MLAPIDDDTVSATHTFGFDALLSIARAEALAVLRQLLFATDIPAPVARERRMAATAILRIKPSQAGAAKPEQHASGEHSDSGTASSPEPVSERRAAEPCDEVVSSARSSAQTAFAASAPVGADRSHALSGSFQSNRRPQPSASAPPAGHAAARAPARAPAR